MNAIKSKEKGVKNNALASISYLIYVMVSYVATIITG